MWNQVRARRVHLRRADRIRTRRSRQRKARSSFLQDPLECARGLEDSTTLHWDLKLRRATKHLAEEAEQGRFGSKERTVSGESKVPRASALETNPTVLSSE